MGRWPGGGVRLLPAGSHGPEISVGPVRGRPSPPALAAPPNRAALGGVIGPVAFVAAWSILGARTSGYSPTEDAISKLAASGAPTQAAMTAGFVVFGTGLPFFASALRRSLPGPAWALAAATGAATLGVAATPLGSGAPDSLHGAFAAVGYATLAAVPLLAARPLAARGRRRWAMWSVVAGATSAAFLAATVLGPRHGLFQRAGLTVTDVWVVAFAVDMLRQKRR